MLKAADVELVLARTICSGKYMVMVRGDVAAVEAAVEAGMRRRATSPSSTPSSSPTCTNRSSRPSRAPAKVEALEALGILESFSVASLIEGADAAVKAANVQLIEVRLAMALGGKAFVTMTGNVAAVEAAVEAGAQVVAQKGMLVNKVVIPSPRPELLTDMI